MTVEVNDHLLEATPTWFGRPERPQFGWLHLPKSGTARAIVVICPPLGREVANALPAFQIVGSRLAEADIAVFRFSYSCTGDSAGSWDDPGHVAEWREDIGRAIAFAGTVTPAPPVVVGMRMGALLAADALEPSAKVAGLVLWDPCASGRDFLRREAALLSTTFGAGQIGDGSVQGPAFTYSPETVGDFEALTLGPVTGGSDVPTLVVARTNSPSIRRRQSAFEGTAAEWVEVDGQPGLIENYPDTLELPEAALDTVCTWIDSRAGDEQYPVTAHTVCAARVLKTEDGRAVSERAVRLGPSELFAMRTEPEGSDGAALTTVVLLSAGALDHTGPGRKWVDLARQFALEGIRSVRIDLEGIGESMGRPGLARNVPKPDFGVDNVKELATALGDPDGAGLVFFGLSSGGYHALEAGLHLHPLGVCSINPGLSLGFPELEHGRLDRRRKAARPMPSALRRVAVKHARVARILWTAYVQVRVSRAPQSATVGIARRGTRVLFLVTDEGTGFVPSLYWNRVRHRMERRGLYQETVLQCADHSLYTPEAMAMAYPVLTEWVTSHFGNPDYLAGGAASGALSDEQRATVD